MKLLYIMVNIASMLVFPVNYLMNYVVNTPQKPTGWALLS